MEPFKQHLDKMLSAGWYWQLPCGGFVEGRRGSLYEINGAHILSECDIELLEWDELLPHIIDDVVELGYDRSDRTSNSDSNL